MSNHAVYTTLRLRKGWGAEDDATVVVKIDQGHTGSLWLDANTQVSSSDPEALVALGAALFALASDLEHAQLLETTAHLRPANAA